jgi:hypothetical protein
VKPIEEMVVRTAVLDGVPVERPSGAQAVFAKHDGALIVTFDEWGGFYDHVLPPRVIDDTNPDDVDHSGDSSTPTDGQLIPDYRQLGFRVPAIVVSNLAPRRVVHHGPFLRHTVAGRSRVTGTAVILVHRLLKNGVGRKGGYVLLTEPVLRSLGIDGERAGLPTYTERYEYLGDIRCYVRDLTPALSLT